MFKKVILISVLCLSIILSGCTKSKSEIKNNTNNVMENFEVEEEKKELYKNIITNFISIFAASKNSNEIFKNIDSKGIYTLKKIENDFNDFENEYEKIYENYKTPDGTWHNNDKNQKTKVELEMEYRIKSYVQSLATNNKIEKIEFVQNTFDVIKINNNLYSALVNVNYDLNNILKDQSKKMKFVFYKDKIIDVIMYEDDDSYFSIFANFIPNVNNDIKTTGRYLKVNKDKIFEGIESEMKFYKDGSVTLHNFESDETFYGIYKLENQKALITLNEILDENGSKNILQKPIVLNLYNNGNSLYSLNSDTFFYQESDEIIKDLYKMVAIHDDLLKERYFYENQKVTINDISDNQKLLLAFNQIPENEIINDVKQSDDGSYKENIKIIDISSLDKAMKKVFGDSIKYSKNDFMPTQCDMYKYDEKEKKYIAVEGGCGGLLENWIENKYYDYVINGDKIIIYEKFAFVDVARLIYGDGSDTNFEPSGIYKDIQKTRPIKELHATDSTDDIDITEYYDKLSMVKYTFKKDKGNYYFYSSEIID